MPATTPQKEALASNCTFCTGDPIIKVTARDGEIVAYAPHTRYLTIDSQPYSPYYPVDVARPSTKVGLSPDTGEFTSPLDDVITKPDIISKRWRGARAYTAYVVDYRNLSLGVVQERNWIVGKTGLRGNGFTMELLSLSQPLHQQIGEFTSGVDRNRTPEELGVDIEDFTFEAEVTAVTDRRIFTVDVTEANAYFRYGRAVWLTGDNADLQMEIEDNVGTLITLQLPMRSVIAIGDTLNLIAGYDGTREQARDKFNAAEAFDGEPDLPGLTKVLTYPE